MSAPSSSPSSSPSSPSSTTTTTTTSASKAAAAQHRARPISSLPRGALRAVGLTAPVVTGGLVLAGRVTETAPLLTAGLAIAAIAVALVVGPTLWGALLRRPAPVPPALAWLGAAGALVLPALPVTGGPTSPILPLVFAIAVMAGGLVAGRRLAALVPAGAAGLALSIAADGPAVLTIVAAVLFFGFAMLGRALFFGTLKAVAVREASRIDAELLRLYDDARLFRLIGGADPSARDEAAVVADEEQRMVARALSVRDGFFRLLRLAARALSPDSVALYVLDPAGKELVLKEQVQDVEAENAARVPATAGALGLSLKKGVPVRLRVGDDAKLAPHRTGVRSVLVVPVKDGRETIGLLVVDRVRDEAFTDAEETFAVALAAELVEQGRTERALDDVERDRKKTARVFAAARAFGGVVRTNEAVDMALKTVLDMGRFAGVAFVGIMKDGERTAMKVVATGGDKGALLEAPALPVTDETWVGRAILQKTTLPHVALADAGAARGVMEKDDQRAKSFGDLRAVPLFAQGAPVGALVVASEKGERLPRAALELVAAAADLAGIAIGGASHFEALERQATTDGLTGLYNRRTLDKLMGESIARQRRAQGALCVVLTDIDHFKSVNDTYGHQTGDDVLKAVAKALQAAARTSDVVARYGGEEFVLVLEATDRAGAARLAERARLAVKALRFQTEKGPLNVTSSFGVGVMSEAAATPEQLLEIADRCLYKAKRSGRDRVVVEDDAPAGGEDPTRAVAAH